MPRNMSVDVLPSHLMVNPQFKRSTRVEKPLDLERFETNMLRLESNLQDDELEEKKVHDKISEHSSGSDFEKIDAPAEVPQDIEAQRKSIASSTNSSPEKKKFGHRIVKFRQGMIEKMEQKKLNRKLNLS